MEGGKHNPAGGDRAAAGAQHEQQQQDDQKRRFQVAGGRRVLQQHQQQQQLRRRPLRRRVQVFQRPVRDVAHRHKQQPPQREVGVSDLADVGLAWGRVRFDELGAHPPPPPSSPPAPGCRPGPATFSVSHPPPVSYQPLPLSAGAGSRIIRSRKNGAAEYQLLGSDDLKDFLL